jgi:hypothetical protein
MRLIPRFSLAPVPLVVCTLMAIALWFYASMREDYTTVFDVPLEVRLPAGRTRENEIAPSVRVQLQGAGWQLLSHALSASVRCVVYVPEKLLTGDDVMISITKQMLAQGMQAPTGVAVQRVMSDSFAASVGIVTEKRLPVQPALEVAMRDGFIITSVHCFRYGAPNLSVCKMCTRRRLCGRNFLIHLRASCRCRECALR